jgi:hypothetical protein
MYERAKDFLQLRKKKACFSEKKNKEMYEGTSSDNNTDRLDSYFYHN